MLRRIAVASFLVLALAWSLLAALPQPTQAQEKPENWSEAKLLLQLPENENGTTPYVFTSASNNTYLLFFGRPVEQSTGPVTLYVARWKDGDWSPIADVLVPPDSGIPAVVAGVEDANGYLHVFWTGSRAWHSRVPVAQMSDPRAWSEPEGVFDQAPVDAVEATTDAAGNVYLAVSSLDRGVYVVRIMAEGPADPPTLIQQIGDADYFPDRISLAMGKAGSLHACWVEVSDKGSRGALCAASRDGGLTWSSPEQVATGHRGVRIFSFDSGDRLVRIIWGGIGVGGRELQWSQDDGETWSPPLDLTQGIPMAGFAGQVVAADSEGALHTLVNPGDSRYVHASLKPSGLSPNLPTGWQAADWINAAVAEGNTLVVAYWIPGSSIYTSHLKLNAPRTAPQEVPSPQASVSPASRPPQSTVAVAESEPATGVPTAPAATSALIATDTTGRPAGSNLAIIAGIAPAFLFVLAVIIFKVSRPRR